MRFLMNQEQTLGVRCLDTVLASRFNNATNTFTDLTYFSKGQLRRGFEEMEKENHQLRQEVLRLKNKLLIRQAEMINYESDSFSITPLMKAV